MKLKDYIHKLSQNRYGYDQFTRFLLVITFFLYLFSVFLQSSMLNLLNLLLLIYIYSRIFSKNIYKRAAENDIYLNFVNSILRFFRIFKKTRGQHRYYHFYKCPKCKQVLRIPKGHGKIEIKCPKCHHRFVRRS